MYNGNTVKMNINRRVVCRGCRSKSDGKCEGCGACPAESRTVQKQVRPGMFMQQQEKVKSKEKCKEEETGLEVMVEKGMVRDPTTWTITRHDGPNHLGL